MSKSDSTSDGFASKPNKPYPDFPLFPHQTKHWAKKIRGNMCYFGPWADPDGALKKYLEQKDALHSGRRLREVSAGVTVKAPSNAFLNHKKSLLDAGELASRTWMSCEQTAKTHRLSYMSPPCQPHLVAFRLGRPLNNVWAHVLYRMSADLG